MKDEQLGLPELELSFRSVEQDLYVVEVRFYPAKDILEVGLINSPLPRIRINHEILLANSMDDWGYGLLLSQMLFSDDRIKDAFNIAVGYAASNSKALRVILRLDPGDEELHGISWERMVDPNGQGFLFQNEQILVTRFLSSPDLTHVPLNKRGLSSLIVVSNPADLPLYHLEPINTAEQLSGLLSALGSENTDIIAREYNGRDASLDNLVIALRDAPDILCILCHGTIRKGETHLWLEGESGKAEPVTGAQFNLRLNNTALRPKLVVLVVCYSAGRVHDNDILLSIGPTLASAGIPAVISIQSTVSLKVARDFFPMFFKELRRDGQIERALAVARNVLFNSSEWWVPVLYSRLRTGKLWVEGGEEEFLDTTNTSGVDLFIDDHSSFIRSRTAHFVGRHEELTAIQKLIDKTLPLGGYILVTGQAGQGKSCVMAKLVESYNPSKTPHHFISFKPGMDYQVRLIRDLMGQLAKKHRLSSIYLTGEARSTLATSFEKMLYEISKNGGKEVIFIDGLDQIDEERVGLLRFIFLPEKSPPRGIVFVLSSRPDNTMLGLKNLSVSHYTLPPLSRQDFEALLLKRDVKISVRLADRFYEAMQRNALYLDLVAQELSMHSTLSPVEMIRKVAKNPDNLFSIAIERFRKKADFWRVVIKPLLGVLLVAREPLSLQSIRSILSLDDESARDALRQLGGFLATDGVGRYYLYHLKFQDFLRESASEGQNHVFARDEEEAWHSNMSRWSEGANSSRGLTSLWQDAQGEEQERRVYGRKYYITHLYYARSWEKLYQVIDDGDYGGGKLQDGTVIPTYLQDLELAAVSTARPELDFQEKLELLPKLWEYTLLRHLLKEQGDKTPERVFTAMVVAGRERQAIALADLITNQLQKAIMLGSLAEAIFVHLGKQQEGNLLLLRALEVILNDSNLTPVEQKELPRLRKRFVTLLLSGGNIESAAQVLEAMEVEDEYYQEGLSEVVRALVGSNRINDAEELIVSINSPNSRLRAQSELGLALISIGNKENAVEIAKAILAELGGDEQFREVPTLRNLAAIFVTSKEWLELDLTCELFPRTSRPNVLREEVANFLLKAGEVDRANRIISLTSGPRKDSLTKSLIEGFLNKSRFSEALSLVGSIVDVSVKVEALGVVVKYLYEMGRQEEMVTYIDAILQEVNKHKGLTARLSSLLVVSKQVYVVGLTERSKKLFDECRALAWEAQEATGRSRLLGDVAKELIELGLYEYAENISLEILEIIDHVNTIQGKITSVLHCSGCYNEFPEVRERLLNVAFNILNISEDIDEELVVRVVEAVLRYQSGEVLLDQSLRLARKMEDSERRVLLLSSIAIALAEMGNRTKASQVISEILELLFFLGDEARTATNLAAIAKEFSLSDFPGSKTLIVFILEQIQISIDLITGSREKINTALAVVNFVQAFADREYLARLVSIAEDTLAQINIIEHTSGRALRRLTRRSREASIEELAELTGRVANSLASISEYDKAIELSLNTKGSELRETDTNELKRRKPKSWDVTLLELLIRAEQWEKAHDFVAFFINSDYEVRAYCIYAAGLYRHGEEQLANHYIQLALGIVESSKEEARVDTYIDVGRGLCKMNQWGMVREIALRIPGSPRYRDFFMWYMEQAIRLGKNDDVEFVRGKIDERIHGTIYCVIVANYVRTENWSKAIVSVRLLPTGVAFGRQILMGLDYSLESRLPQSQVEELRKVFDAVVSATDSDNSPAKTLHLVSQLLLKSGKIKLVKQLVRDIQQVLVNQNSRLRSEEERREVLIALANVQGALYDWDGLIRSLQDAWLSTASSRELNSLFAMARQIFVFSPNIARSFIEGTQRAHMFIRIKTIK